METTNHKAIGGTEVPTALSRAAGEPGWMLDLRLAAYRQFREMDWPTPQEEEWRRTDITGLDFDQYLLPDSASQSTQTPAQGQESLGKPDAVAGEYPVYAGRLRFDGIGCIEQALGKEAQAGGVFLAPLRRALEESPSGNGSGKRVDRLRQLFSRVIAEADNRLLAWHYGVWTHGTFLYVPPNTNIELPFLIEMGENGRGILSSPHLIMYVDEGASAKVIYSVVGRADDSVLCNAGVTGVVADGARLTYVGLQDLGRKSTYFDHSTFTVGRDSVLNHYQSLFGSGLSKTRLDVSVQGSGADAQLGGVFLAGEGQHMDIRTVQHHAAPRSTSQTFYRGAVKRKGRTIYQGLIEVTEEGQKTDAYLSNKNLILEDGARSDSIPSLKIGTNDVKCSHGSTTGKLRDEELFYLMSRGIPRNEARRELILAFFEDVIRRTPEAAREPLRSRILESLDGE